MIVHLRETDRKETVLSLTNDLTGEAFSIVEVDVTGNPVSAPSLKIGPLESKFFRIVL